MIVTYIIMRENKNPNNIGFLLAQTTGKTMKSLYLKNAAQARIPLTNPAVG